MHHYRLLSLFLMGLLLQANHTPPSQPETRTSATLIQGLGTYSRKISTDSRQAQQFFDQGLRLTYGYYFPEAIASFQEAQRHDPEHPMILWGLALAIGPNPNSRKARKVRAQFDRAWRGADVRLQASTF